MVLLTHGNIFNSTAQMIVNPVNCAGIMGKGLAKEFKKNYPDMFDSYQSYCKSNRLFMGSLFIYKCYQTKKPDYIVCFPTKIHWSDISKYEHIATGLKALRKTIIDLHITSIAMPALGCGLGQLEFTEIIKLIVDNFVDLKDVKIYVFKPWEGEKNNVCN